MANNTQQFVTVTTTHPVQEIKNKKVIFGLGVVEVILGAISIVLGAVLCGQFGYYSILGEGIWCGIWFTIAGALGMAAGRKSAGVGLINAHMGFSIWGSVAAGVMVCTCGSYTALFPLILNAQDAYPYQINSVRSEVLGTVVPILAVSAVIGFIAFILLIVSAAYCCCSTPYNCCSCCCAQSYPAQPHPMQTVYTQQTFEPAGNQATVYPPQNPVQANQPQVAPGKYAPLYNQA
ncbi:uncharacterized protein LOC143461932 [Clavelina lepadiformis]|uniref:uncharacterized protein LOC143461932 n=1 Tax=Clavelina lepadiformis TaxID=159417 RepID=UPI00404175C6